MVDGSGTAVAIGHTESFTIHDADMAHVPGDYSGIMDVHGMEVVNVGATHSYDGSASDHGLIVNGSDGNDIIIGSSHDDIIFGGGGNDTLTGGLGDDIFGWHSADHGTAAAPAVDTITDFSMNVGADPIAHNGTAGDDHLDLRDLISGARDNTLDNYLSITQNGANAELHIHTDGDPSSAPTQTIVLADVYTNHGVDFNSGTVNQDIEHVNELIKQHIILNS